MWKATKVQENVQENGDNNAKEVDVNLSGLVGEEDNGSCKAVAAAIL